jgi:hypothetical protein
VPPPATARTAAASAGALAAEAPRRAPAAPVLPTTPPPTLAPPVQTAALAPASVAVPAAAALSATAAAPAVLAPGGAAGAPSLVFVLTGPAQARVGERFEVSLRARAIRPAQIVPVQIRFDPKVFTVESVRAGEVARGAGITRLEPTIEAQLGRVDLTLSTLGASRIQGEGELLALTLVARAARDRTQLSMAGIRLTGEDPVIAAQPVPLTLQVAP